MFPLTFFSVSTISRPPFLRSLFSFFAAVTMIMLSPKFSACAGPFKKYNNLKATERVATTPLYYLCNSRGQSFIQEDNQIGNPDQRAMVYFMSSKDATNYLQEMAQAMGGNANELRINTVSMEKVNRSKTFSCLSANTLHLQVLDQIRSKKQSRKLGRIPLDINIRIQVIPKFRWHCVIVIFLHHYFSQLRTKFPARAGLLDYKVKYLGWVNCLFLYFRRKD
jgi:hypothetical protein